MFNEVIHILDFRVTSVPLQELYLDPSNYRLIHHEHFFETNEDELTNSRIQLRIRTMIAGPKNQNISDLLSSFREVGFLLVNHIQVVQIETHIYKVIEGNRRVTALKYLQDHSNNMEYIGELSVEFFDAIPVVVYENESIAELQVVKGLQHIGGVKNWPALSQAQYIKDLLFVNRQDEKTVSQMLGISTVRLRRALRTLALINEFRNSEYSSHFNEEMYSIFEEIIRSPQLRNWIGWHEEYLCSTNIVNRERLFSWIGISDDQNYGVKGNTIHQSDDPLISKSTDIRILKDVITDEKFLNLMESTGSLQLAVMAKSQIVLGRIAQYQLVNKKIVSKETSSHFSSVVIENYKLLKNVQIDHLNHINLFAGINNTGKSSLLEAVYLLTRGNDMYSLFDVYRKRGKFHEDVNAEWIDDQFRGDIFVQGVYSDQDVSLYTHKEYEKDQSLDKNSYISTISTKAKWRDDTFLSRSRLYRDKANETFYEQIYLLCNSSMSSPFSEQDQEEVRWFHEKSVERKNLESIIQFLKEQVDDNIEDIQLAGVRNPRFLVSHRLFKNSLDITQFGEGIQRIFHLSLMFAAAENGVLFIDELENAIHYTLLKKFTLLIENLAERFNVQVFLTSHSKECINAFLYNSPDNKNISAYRLERDNDQIRVIHVSGEQLYNLVETHDVDLRGEA